MKETTSLAPMEGITSFPMRLWLTWASRPARMTTPFLRVNRVQPEKHLPLLFAPELFVLRDVLGYELTPQFLSADPESFVRAATFFDHVDVPAIELNCGCPCPTCIGKNAGSGILADPDAFEKTVATAVRGLGDSRFAVKMRLGYHDDTEFDDLLDCVAAQPLARLTVHGRTRRDGYRGTARWAAIAKAAEKAKAPTWGSGDVVDAASHHAFTAVAPTAAGVMIGRGALRNPWVFDEIRRNCPVSIDLRTLANALLAFTLVHEIAIKDPEKLVAKVASGRLVADCGTDCDRWERIAATLSTLVCGVPLVWSPKCDISAIAVSPTTFGRLKFLWGHLNGSLPDSFASPKLLRAKSLPQFFALLEDLGPRSGSHFQLNSVGSRLAEEGAVDHVDKLGMTQDVVC